MKKIILSLLLFTALFQVSNAQTKALQVVKIATPTVQCEMCKGRIEQYLKRIDGVTYVNVAVKKKEITLKFLSDRTDIETIKTSIANAGYDVAKAADDPTKPLEVEIAANPESYSLLPKCCKKPTTGSSVSKQ